MHLRQPLEVIAELEARIKKIKDRLIELGTHQEWKPEFGLDIKAIQDLNDEVLNIPKRASELSIALSRLPKGALHDAPVDEDNLARMLR